ncbi:hypothetical protein HPB50_008777 [Hyalomma asiaticum]|uniref:Uncharacterized protein n=1 Tax=Hyalomma asiaticum TaxID=266040 RepID=A0ACB7S850_HYAAI|nr:hypothetical protein HPB50_008777 [Hyalomma asiaticum]
MSRLTWIEFISVGCAIKACLDSKSDRTFLREELIAAQAKLPRVVNVRLRGACGNAVPAHLMFVPLGLHTAGEAVGPELIELCAATDKLEEGVEALLMPDTWEKLTQVQIESVELAAQRVRSQENAAEDADREYTMRAEEVSRYRPVSTESREGSSTEVLASRNEADNEVFVKD